MLRTLEYLLSLPYFKYAVLRLSLGEKQDFWTGIGTAVIFHESINKGNRS